MRVERSQHALDGAFDELLVGDRLDVIVADLLEHFGEEIDADIALVGGGDGGSDGDEGDEGGRSRDFKDAHGPARLMNSGQIGTGRGGLSTHIDDRFKAAAAAGRPVNRLPG